MKTEFVWVEKYRPKTIDECILPKYLEKTFKGIVESGSIPNLLFYGSPGVGKTTVAKALCNELGLEYLVINGSKDNGIDVLRTTVVNYASSKSFNGKKKVIIFDEADHMNPNSLQPALRSAIEEFSSTCSFVFTCNYPAKIIEPLHSRCPSVDFTIKEEDKEYVMRKLYSRLLKILDVEGVAYDSKVVGAVMLKYFPDMRRTLGELQKYSVYGVIDNGILSNLNDENINSLKSALSEKDFRKILKWVNDNVYSDSSRIYSLLFKELEHMMDGENYANSILIIQKYQYQSSFSANQEICMIACLLEIAANCDFL